MYFNNPADYLANLDGDHLDWLRTRVFLLLTVGQGDWETQPHELDLWGHHAAHDWPWWRKQLAYHLPRFC